MYEERHKVLKVLLKHADTSDVNKCNDFNYTPLYLASLFGRIENVRILLTRDDIDIRVRGNPRDDTAYDAAGRKSQYHNRDAIQHLIMQYEK